MRRPRWATRYLLIGIALIAVALGLGYPAVRVRSDRDIHYHTFLVNSGDARKVRLMTYTTGSPFWPRYLRCLYGEPWRKQPLCEVDEEKFREVCEFARPEIVMRDPSGRVVEFGLTPAQAAASDPLQFLGHLDRTFGGAGSPIP